MKLASMIPIDVQPHPVNISEVVKSEQDIVDENLLVVIMSSCCLCFSS